MANTIFVDGATPIVSAWLNDVNNAVYNGIFPSSGNFTMSGFLTVGGVTTLNGATTINNILTVSGITTLNGASTINNTLTVGGITTLSGATTINNTLHVTGVTTLAAMSTSALTVGSTLLSAAGFAALIGTTDGTVQGDINFLQSYNTTGPAADFHNRIINGDMRIDQRNAGASQTITTAGPYTVDRFYCAPTGASVTGQRVAGSGVNQYNYQITGAASVTAIEFGQKIEATNIWDLEGQTVTLSVDLANSLLTTVTWTAWYPTATDNWAGRTQISTGTFTVTSSLARYSTQISLPSNVTAGLEIALSVGAQTSGTWTIGRMQLESGSVATTFERLPITTELQLCQRYFAKTFDQNVAPAQNSGSTDGALYSVGQVANQPFGAMYKWPVTLRILPALTTYSPNAASANWSTNTTTPTASVAQSGQESCAFAGTTSVTAGNGYTLHITANAEL